MGLIALPQPVQSQNTQVILDLSSPQVHWAGQRHVVLGRDLAEVWTNVTSSHDIANVTLYYLDLNQTDYPPEGPNSEQNYNRIQMRAFSYEKTATLTEGTYFADSPPARNMTTVFVFLVRTHQY